MTKIDFYHLQNQTLENVLPKLLEKSYQLGKKILVKIGNEERIDFINNLLWTYDEESFLPHGSKKDGHAEMQPIWLTSEDKNPNNADFLFLTDGATASCEEIAKFEEYLIFLTATHKPHWKMLAICGKSSSSSHLIYLTGSAQQAELGKNRENKHHAFCYYHKFINCRSLLG